MDNNYNYVLMPIFLCYISIFQSIALTVNAPVNSRSPNWYVYRLSKPSMQSLVLDSSHFRITCNFEKQSPPVDFRDYLRVSLKSLSPLVFTGRGTCKMVEYINIR